MRRVWWASAVCVMMLCRTAFALDLPPQPDGYITDRAGLLSSEIKASLEQRLGAFEQQTSTQIVAAIFPSLDGESLEDVTIHLAERWKIGQRDKDNGVLLIIFPQDRKMRIEVGYGLEGALTDAVSTQIISQVIAPRFRAGDFDGGVSSGVTAIMAAVQGEFAEVASQRVARTQDLGPIARVLLIIICILSVVDLLRFQVYWFRKKRNPDHYGFAGWWFRFALLLFLFNFFFRMLLQVGFMSQGGYYGNRSGFGGGGDGGGGGFGGGGGGSFGGGGASGGW